MILLKNWFLLSIYSIIRVDKTTNIFNDLISIILETQSIKVLGLDK